MALAAVPDGGQGMAQLMDEDGGKQNDHVDDEAEANVGAAVGESAEEGECPENGEKEMELDRDALPRQGDSSHLPGPLLGDRVVGHASRVLTRTRGPAAWHEGVGEGGRRRDVRGEKDERKGLLVDDDGKGRGE